LRPGSLHFEYGGGSPTSSASSTQSSAGGIGSAAVFLAERGAVTVAG